MSSVRPTIAVVMVAAFALSGCFGPSMKNRGPEVSAPTGFDPSQVAAESALITSGGEGAAVWANIIWDGPLTLSHAFRFTIPKGVTLVEAMVERAPGVRRPTIALYNQETSRIRCQPEYVTAWLTDNVGFGRCSGIPIVDPLPATWRSQNTLFRLLDGEKLSVHLTGAALDGQAAKIDLSQLTMPHLAARPTEIVQVASSKDGVKLHVEVTRPETEDPVPTILVSSPYNTATRMAGLRSENSTISDWVPRGYAVVSADVRGFGDSEGCVEVWSANEQQDQVDLVEWIARQPWSDGKVGFYGQSYVGTTPVEAASLAAPHLTTIITVAPVINAYEDWHFGGVPNGEDFQSPIFYMAQDTQDWAEYSVALAQGGKTVEAASALVRGVQQPTHGFCDLEMVQQGAVRDPHGVYDEFFVERNFKAKARDVKASVFYTQGFYDTNVKSQMIPGWFDELQVPKKALFGDWIHQHPPRADQELLFHAWFDEWLMGRDTGILETPVVEVKTNVDTVRTADTWPPRDANTTKFFLDPSKSALSASAGSGSASYLASPKPKATNAVAPSQLVFNGERLEERLYISGQATLDLRASLVGGENTHFYAQLLDVPEIGAAQMITFGMLNAGLRDGYTTYKTVPPNQPIDYHVPFLVTEYVVEAGHELRLVLRAADVDDWVVVSPTQPGQVTIAGGEATALRLPTLPQPGDVKAPTSAGPVDSA